MKGRVIVADDFLQECDLSETAAGGAIAYPRDVGTIILTSVCDEAKRWFIVLD